MGYKVEYSAVAQKELLKIDNHTSKKIVQWMRNRISDCENPRLWGKPLTGSFSNKWRYRIGDYRVLCNIKDNIVTVQVVSIGHRKEIYK